MDVLQDVFALFVIFAITLVVVLALLSLATGLSGLGDHRGQEKRLPESGDDDGVAREAARAEAQETNETI
jgi:hypothetical protein